MRDEIKIEILKAISIYVDEGPRATNIGNACGLNYINAKEVLDEMETIDKTVIRYNDGRYKLREAGKAVLKIEELGPEKCKKVMDIVMKFTKEKPVRGEERIWNELKSVVG